MPDEIGDGMRLTGPGRALHHDGVFCFEFLDHSSLLRIGVLGQQQVDRRCRGCVACCLLGRAFFSADQSQQGLRQTVQGGELFDIRFERLDVALATIA